MEQNNILVRDLCKKFDSFSLDHVSFQVPKGRIVGFIGENGAGKSTTMNTISSVRENIGVVFDECSFHDVFNTDDIEKILSGVYKCWDSSLYRQYLNRFNIPEKKPIGSFSKGMKMKLSIIRLCATRCWICFWSLYRMRSVRSSFLPISRRIYRRLRIM